MKTLDRSGLGRAWLTIGAMRHRTLWSCTAIFIAGHLLFLVGLTAPGEPYFDEVHYVAAARQLLAHGPPQNPEHPPLVKELIAASMAVWGDNPFGWRYMSALFGAAALAGVYAWAVLLFDSRSAALWTTALTCVNQMLYVQSRVAMLDVFMVAFMIWAMVVVTASWRSQRVRLCFAATGVCLGLAIASKWVGLIPWLMIVGIVISVRILQNWKVSFADPTPADWYRPDLWQEMRLRDWAVSLVLLPAALYWLTFVPAFGWDLSGFIHRQGEMWRGLASVTAAHPYSSDWSGWPIAARPIWYLFEAVPGNPELTQAVVFLGNPVILWSGIAAVAACLYGWLAAARRDAFIVLVTWLALYGTWALVPKKTSFFYYYFPAGMVLSLALAYAFYVTPLAKWPWVRHVFLGLAMAIFLYFLPVTSAAITITLPGYNDRVWFDSWR
jgi:dolichyl-phosphate-mannose--protein O-mannosyl transferase